MIKLTVRNRSGMSMIETVMAIVIIGIGFYTLISVFATLAPRNFNVENINKKVYLAQGKMEEYLAKGFYVTGVGATTFETASLKNYSYKVIVTTVATNNLDSQVASSPFKNVKVDVWGGPLDAAGTVELVTVVGSVDAQ
jgi:prepilin-type N-terminal cleavage/methylation domain-containing protein